MSHRPILFSAPMVRAILAGRKTQTRRIVKPQPTVDENGMHFTTKHGKFAGFIGHAVEDKSHWLCPYGVEGDRLWVRETWGYTRQCDDMGNGDVIAYAAGGEHVYEDVGGKRRLRLTKSGAIMRPNHYCYPPKPWKPSIHMPRWASRITLEITGVRVERLQEIGHRDAAAEGWPADDEARALAEHAPGCADDAAIEWYADLWDSINGPGSWDANPWVWVVEFKRVTP